MDQLVWSTYLNLKLIFPLSQQLMKDYLNLFHRRSSPFTKNLLLTAGHYNKETNYLNTI